MDRCIRIGDVRRSFCRHSKSFDVSQVYVPLVETSARKISFHIKPGLDLSRIRAGRPSKSFFTPEPQNGVDFSFAVYKERVEQTNRRLRDDRRASLSCPATNENRPGQPNPKAVELNRQLKTFNVLRARVRQGFMLTQPTPKKTVEPVRHTVQLSEAPRHSLLKRALEGRGDPERAVATFNTMVERRSILFRPSSKEFTLNNFFLRRGPAKDSASASQAD